jgi:hypothetical protein
MMYCCKGEPDKAVQNAAPGQSGSGSTRCCLCSPCSAHWASCGTPPAQQHTRQHKKAQDVNTHRFKHHFHFHISRKMPAVPRDSRRHAAAGLHGCALVHSIVHTTLHRVLWSKSICWPQAQHNCCKLLLDGCLALLNGCLAFNTKPQCMH